MIIYKITNTTNNKVYIGQTTSKNGFNGRYRHSGVGIERVYKYYTNRKNSGNINDSYNDYLLRAINKYGFESFIVDEVFDVASTIEELNEKEQYWIKYYSCNNSKYGYNSQAGGNDYRANEETKLKIKNWHLGRKLSEEHRKNISNCQKIKICQYSISGVFIKEHTSLIDASIELGMFAQNINAVLKNKYKQANSFIFKYSEDVNVGDNIDAIEVYFKNREINQYDLNGNFINKWKNLQLILKYLGIKNANTLTDCIKCRREVAYGYKWSYD